MAQSRAAARCLDGETVTVVEAAALLGVARSRVYQLVAAGRLPVASSQRPLRLSRAAVVEHFYASVPPPSRPRRPVLARAWDHIVVEGECWRWTGAITPKWGPIIADEVGRMVAVARVLWTAAHGPNAPGTQLVRTCTLAGCVRPAHRRLRHGSRVHTPLLPERLPPASASATSAPGHATYATLPDLLAAITTAEQAGLDWTASRRSWPGPAAWELSTWTPGCPPPLPSPVTDERLTTDQAAAVLGLSVRQVKAACQRGTLAAALVPVAGHRPSYRIPPAAVEQYRRERLGRRGRTRATSDA